MPAPKIADPATKVSAPAAAISAILSTLTPPSIDLQADVAAAGIDNLARFTQLVQGRGYETLAAETRVDRHQQHHVDLVDDVVEVVQRGGRVEHQPRLAALTLDQLQGTIDVIAGFRVKGDVAGARVGEIGNDAVDRLDHQVHIDFRGDAVLAQCLADQRTDGEVRHVVVVHDIEMDDVGARLEDVIHLLAETREVSRQNRGCYLVIWHNPNPLR